MSVCPSEDQPLNFVPFDANDTLIPALTITSYSRLLVRKEWLLKRMVINERRGWKRTFVKMNVCPYLKFMTVSTTMNINSPFCCGNSGAIYPHGGEIEIRVGES